MLFYSIQFGKVPLYYAVQQEKSDVVKFFVGEVKMDTTKLDHVSTIIMSVLLTISY